MCIVLLMLKNFDFMREQVVDSIPTGDNKSLILTTYFGLFENTYVLRTYN